MVRSQAVRHPVKATIVYFSKSGNTRGVAEAMAEELGVPCFSVNLMEKKGRGTKEEQAREKELFNEALEASRGADLVLIGTPTSFQQAKSQILRFTRQVEAQHVGLFCTHQNKLGTTLSDLEEILHEGGIELAGSLAFDNLKPGQLGESDKATRGEYLDRARIFARECCSRAAGG
jgi:flavodoxin